jgi:hypothetical protein
MVIKVLTGHKVFTFNHGNCVFYLLKAKVTKVNEIPGVLVASGGFKIRQKTVAGFTVNFRFLSFVSKSLILAVFMVSGYPPLNHIKIIALKPV